nr:MAG TPA: hypothetical protein [Caudoviricetes sp.]
MHSNLTAEVQSVSALVASRQYLLILAVIHAS